MFVDLKNTNRTSIYNLLDKILLDKIYLKISIYINCNIKFYKTVTQ